MIMDGLGCVCLRNNNFYLGTTSVYNLLEQETQSTYRCSGLGCKEVYERLNCIAREA